MRRFLIATPRTKLQNLTHVSLFRDFHPTMYSAQCLSFSPIALWDTSTIFPRKVIFRPKLKFNFNFKFFYALTSHQPQTPLGGLLEHSLLAGLLMIAVISVTRFITRDFSRHSFSTDLHPLTFLFSPYVSPLLCFVIRV